MPSGGTGATAKVYIQAEVIDNFKEQAAKIKSGLGKGLKDLKDLDLNFAFDEKDTAKAVGMELDKITTMLSDKKLSQLDFSSILPAMVNFLNTNDDSVSDTIKWQLVQGFREGLDEIKKLSSSDLKAFMRTGDDLAAGIISNSAIQETINSLLLTGSDKTNIQYEFQDTIKKIMGNNGKKAAQDVTKLISLKQLQQKDDKYSGVLKYLISGTVGEDGLSIFDLPSINKSIDVQTLKREKANAQGRLSINQYKDLAGYVARLKYLADYSATEEDKKTYQDRYDEIIKDDAYKTLIANATQNQKQAMDAISILVEKASAERDALYQSINQSDFIDPEKGFYNIIKQLSLVSGQHGTASKMLPLWFEKGNFLKEFTIEELLPNTMRMGFEDNGLTEGNADDSTNVKRAEDAADRAEDAANKAEKARDETKKISQEVKDTIEKGTDDKKASKKENEPPSSEPATRAEKKEEKAVESSNEALRQEEEVQRELENIQKQRKQLEEERDKLSKESNSLQAEAKTAKAKYEEIERDLEKAKNKRNNSNQELSKRTSGKNQLEKNITTRESNIKKIDGKIDEIREQKNRLKKELSDYNKETEQMFKSEEYQQQKEAYEQREAVIAEIKQAFSNNPPFQINKEIEYYNQILDNKVVAKGEDESLKLVQEKAEQLKTRKKDLEVARTNLENATDEDREELTKIEATLSKKYTLSKVDFLQSIQNARKQGVKDKDLVSYFNENPEQYGLKESISKVVKKDGTFAKRFDSSIQKELDDIINPIKQQLDKKKAELKTLQECLNALDAQMADLNSKIGNYEKNTPEKREATAQKKQKEIDELERQEGSLLSKRQREDNALQQDKNELARPRYQKLDEAKAENDQLKATVQQLQADAKEAKKASKQAADAAKAKQDALQEVENQLKITTDEETRLNNELNTIRERKQSEAPPSSEPEPEPEHVEEEVGQVRKSREELQAEREKLEAEIQNSAATMSEAEKQINQINKDINWTSRRVKENEDIRLPAMKGFTQQAQQKKAELEEIEQELINISQERESLENQFQQITQAKKGKINAQKWLDYIDSFIGNDDLQELDRLQHIPFTEKGKPQKQKATDELKRISQLYMEHRQGIGDYADQDNGVWKDAYTVLHYRAMEQAKKHQVADSTLSREQFDSDDEYFYQESLNKLKEEREFYRKIYEEEDKTIRQNQEQVERLQELQNREKELQNAKKQKTKELGVAQDNVAGLQEVESEIQTDKTRLTQLQQQRDEQQRIYDDAKRIQEESLQRQAEIDRMIAEADSREQQAPATTQEKPSAPVSSGQAEEESPVVQNLEQQIKEVEQTIKTVEIKQKELLAKKEELNKLLGKYGKEANNTFYLTDNTEETSQYWQQAGSSTKDPATGAARQLREKGQIFKDTIDAIKEQKKLLNTLDKESDEYQQAEQKLQQLEDKKSRDWLAFYRAHEELNYWVDKDGETNFPTRAQQTLNKWTPERMGLENLGFSQENLDKMIADVKGQAERLAQMRADVAACQEQYNQLQEQINTLNTKRDNLIAESQRSKPAETEPPQGTSAETPLSSSGAETANGVQEEGNEAGDAASKMQALAQAKKEALEANKQLAESANTTQKAIQNESDAGNFDELITKLVEAAKLLAQLPQSFEGFKGFDLEPLNSLSQAIQQFPKEGFNISLGDSFNNLANNIDKTLQKVQELTSQAKNAEIENTFAEKYDEQIRQLKTDVEEAKRVIEELKKAQTIKQSSSIDEYDPTLDSTTARTRKRNVAKRISKQQTPEIDPLAKEYGLLYQAQQESFKANNINEYNTALEKSESILQRISELEQKIFSDYGKNPYQDELLSRNYSQLLQDNSQNKNNVQASKNSINNFIEKQNAEIENLENRVNNIQLIPEETQTNWDQAYIDKYNSIKESAQEVTTTVRILKETLAQASATGLDQNTLRAFLEFKQSATEQIASTQKENDTFKSSIASMSNEYINKLSEVENRLLTIKKNSEKLINIDPSIGNTLIFVEQYLNKIKDLKETVSKEPLAIYDSDVKGRIDTTISELTDKKNEEDEQSMLEQMEQVSERSQTDLDRIVNNYSRYTTALNKLFTDIAKGSKSSADELEKDFKRINDFSSKLVNATGLEQGDLLKGELKSSASPRIVDAQTEAYNKNAIAFEGMYTKIESKAESAKNKIEEIFGDMDITKSLDEKFIGGNVEGFNEFVQKATQVEKVLKNLKKIQETIKTDDTWLLQKKNADELRQTIATLETSLTSVSKASSNFRIVDDLDVQELRASTKQYIRDNPALTGGEISELNNYIDQLQNKINTVDFKNIEDGIKSVQQSAKEAGHTGDTFMSMLTQRFKSLGTYLLSFVSFYEVIGVFKQGIGIIHELDDALTEMNKVSTESLASLKDYQKESFGVANDVGTTATQLQQSTADFVRLGESFQEAKESARVANELLTVSEFDNIQDATTALTAISAAYEDTANGLDKQAIIDKLNKIGDEYAISTDGLATALQDSASALTTANNDMDEAAALLAAGNTVTQDPSKTGKAMRTVALRLVGMKCA